MSNRELEHKKLNKLLNAIDELESENCLSITRAGKIALNNDIATNEEKEHLKECPLCQRLIDNCRLHSEHPSFSWLVLWKQGKAQGDDLVSLNYHMEEENCRRCQDVLRLVDEVVFLRQLLNKSKHSTESLTQLSRTVAISPRLWLPPLLHQICCRDAISASSLKKLKQESREEPLAWETEDGRVKATLCSRDAEIVVTVETKDSSLAGGVVHFALVRESKKGDKTICEKKMTLKPSKSSAGLWTARQIIKQLVVPGPCRPVIWVEKKT